MWSTGPLEQVQLVLTLPRSNRPRRSPKRVEPEATIGRSALHGVKRIEVKRGVEYTVQSHSGAAEDVSKVWTCPHCNLQIVRGTSHIVAWDERGSHIRRHFHTMCWQKWQGQIL